MMNKDEIKETSVVNSNNNIESINNDFITKCIDDNEKGDAELFASLVKNKNLFDHTVKKWRIYKDGIWQIDNIKATRKYAHEILPKTYFDYAKQLDDLISDELFNNNEKVNIKSLEKRRDYVRKRGQMLNTKNRIENILELSTSYLSCTILDFDKNPELFNLKNGTLNLLDFSFNTHKPEDLITVSSEAFYEPDAVCIEFENFIKKIFLNNDSLIIYIQKVLGYCLTGKTDLQCMYFCYGVGKNGKSTFFQLLKMLFGDYFKNIPADTIMTKQNNDNASLGYLASLKGARIVVTSELPKGRSFNEALLKNITGQDTINARNLYENPFQFEPTHKLFTYGNHKPIIKGNDNGIWRRINLVPFNYSVPKEEQIELSVLMNTFRKELSGILNWVIQGYKLFLEEGLNPPEIIINSNTEYRNDSDLLSEFLESNCDLTDTSCHVYSKDIFLSYEKYCNENNEKLEYSTSKNLTNNLKERGYKTEKGTANKTKIIGLKLKE